jgi:hypothetical protein
MALTCCYYADSGGGKTKFCGTAESAEVAYTDVNMLSAEMAGFAYRPIRSWQELVDMRQDIMMAIQDGRYVHKTVCLDTLTATESLIAWHALKRSFIDFGDWRQKIIPPWRDEIMKWLEFANPKAYEQPVDVILTARIQYMSPKEGARFASVDVPGYALAKELFAWCDLVLHGTMEEGIDDNNLAYSKYVCYTQRHMQEGMPFLAKDGSGILDRTEDPNFRAIKAKIDAKLASKAKA